MNNWLVILDGIVWKIDTITKEIYLNESINGKSVESINKLLEDAILKVEK